MRSRTVLPLAVLAGFVVLGVAGAAAVDRSVDPVPTAAGFGAGPVQRGHGPHRGLGGGGRPGAPSVAGVGQRV